MKVKKIVIACCIIFIFLPCKHFQALSATENKKEDVIINIDKLKYLGGYSYEAIVSVIFNDLNLYNEDIFLSYHIYDKNSNEELLFENERTPIILDNKQAIINYQINITKEIKSGIIRFDIVDEKNSYWFSQNNNIKVSIPDIEFTYNLFSSIKATLGNGIMNHPYIFFTNLLICILSIIIISYIKKKEILSWREL